LCLGKCGYLYIRTDICVVRKRVYVQTVKDGQRKRATGGIRRLLLTNPLNSQLDTNVANQMVSKKWF
jgi:hypothetical protein